ncbi:hypothetical protein H6F76_16795 [Leptolyngbya sp. FACHB-321]|uniref:hypothetical protein n=1 Tax=Leptolyngbya sp. FACHB-321 TaxID=2692807 RepID=UPI001682BED1|nr:hypothetical protein [Leptolyngbya sp. FACHB-321]MBD2036669.1 hypothetical protein [Leptolyngbya sp. FACHB-321]
MAGWFNPTLMSRQHCFIGVSGAEVQECLPSALGCWTTKPESLISLTKAPSCKITDVNARVGRRERE